MELELLERLRNPNAGGTYDCFHCRKTSTTAHMCKDAARLKRATEQVSHLSGGMYSNDCCHHQFFLCRRCCLDFHEKTPTNLLKLTQEKGSRTFLSGLSSYVEGFNDHDVVRLPKDVMCMACSVATPYSISIDKPHELEDGVIDLAREYEDDTSERAAVSQVPLEEAV